MKPITAVVKNLYFGYGGKNGMASGSVWKSQKNENGFIRHLCGCEYVGAARVKVESVQPGDEISITDYLTKVINGTRGSYEKIVIRDFEVLHQALFKHEKR